MEAKGCANAMVWKDARRRFYWTVRSRVARSAALAKIEKASPGASLSQRLQLLNSLAEISGKTSDQAAAMALEGLDLKPLLTQLKSDFVMQQMVALVHADKKATVHRLAQLISSFADEDKSALITAVQNANLASGKLFSNHQGLLADNIAPAGPPSYTSI